MKFFSIKWKLSLSFIALALGIAGCYVKIAKQTFESDKISYIFDTEQRENSQEAQNLNQQMTRFLFDARAIFAGYDVQTRKLSPAADQLLQAHELIQGVQIVDLSDQSTASFAKVGETLPNRPALGQALEKGDFDLTHLTGSQFIITALAPGTEKTYELRTFFEMKNLFSDRGDDEVTVLTKNRNVLLASDSPDLRAEVIEGFLNQSELLDVTSTSTQELAGTRYLISSTPLKRGGLRVYSFVKESTALSALRILYRRSLFFLLFSFFATIVLSLILSSSLTRNMMTLTVVAEKIGRGDFQARADFVSKDETGILARAFEKMAKEIENLLRLTVDKTRMDLELQTARLVQESFFPERSQLEVGHLRLNGLYISSSECSGDWWYYYQRGEYLYFIIADATGHGTPAALITAAARSLVSVLQTTDLTLIEIAERFDDAIFQCSKKRVCMTAFILKIHVTSGAFTFLNASHEPPVILSRVTDSHSYKGNYILSTPGSILGEQQRSWREEQAQIAPGEKLVLFTDGLLSIQNAGQVMSERRFMKILEASAQNSPTSTEMLKEISEQVQAFGHGEPIPDDITLAIIENIADGDKINPLFKG